MRCLCVSENINFNHFILYCFYPAILAYSWPIYHKIPRKASDGKAISEKSEYPTILLYTKTCQGVHYLNKCYRHYEWLVYAKIWTNHLCYNCCTLKKKCVKMDGWLVIFRPFLIVFQSYQDNIWMIMKGCVQCNSIYGWEDLTSSEDQTQSNRSVGQG